ncbi:hypothetical protein DFQ26_001585 [Actinomortierella ambigua]|nr:hypothetical protein DFQ26_001585 [Actinomortierella ambigua]
MTKEHSPSPSRIQDGSFYNAALTIVRQVLNRRINRNAQESLARVHRALLMQDIQDYLSGSNRYLLRVFVNVDYRLSKPAMIPGNRCVPLEDYVAHVLRPEIELRIQTWDEAEYQRPPLPVPRNVSLVTLTGWMLTYPIIYVIPKSRRRTIAKAYHSDDGDHSEEVDDEEEDEDNDLLGRNCLANYPLVVTRISLEPNSEIAGLQEHAFMSFSFPADLDPPGNAECDDGCHRGSRPPSQDFSSLPPARTSSDGRHPLRTNSTSTQDSIMSAESTSSPLTITSADSERFYPDDDDIESAVLSPRPTNGSHVLIPQPPAASAAAAAADAPRMNDKKEQIAPTKTDRADQQAEQQEEAVEEQEVCVFAAGRSFLHQLHVRFQQQKLWTNWQVGQETVTLPVVAM